MSKTTTLFIVVLLGSVITAAVDVACGIAYPNLAIAVLHKIMYGAWGWAIIELGDWCAEEDHSVDVDQTV